MLKIFKDHVCKTSILDDFGFYDNREKIMQEKKSRRQYPVEKVCECDYQSTLFNDPSSICTCMNHIPCNFTCKYENHGNLAFVF